MSALSEETRQASPQAERPTPPSALGAALSRQIGGVAVAGWLLLGGSLLFGMAALATRGLAVPIGLHAMWNVGQWILGEKELPGLWKVWMEDRLQTRAQEVGMVSYLLGAGIAILGFWWRYRKNRVSESRS